MRVTSPAFTPFSIERPVDCNIQFELLDEKAKNNAVPSVSSYDITQLDQLIDGITVTEKYATLEPNSWLLNGSLKILPDDISGIQTGWWSGLSGEDCTFDTPPVLSFHFGGLAISTIGFTLYFDDTAGLPASIRITTYDEYDTVIVQKTFTNSKAFFVADMPVQNYYRVTFEFLSTSPAQRRVRVLECLFGIVQIFNRDNLASAEFSYSADITSGALPSRQLTFTFNNSDHKYNLINPDGLYAYLQEGQNIKTAIIINGESVDMGTFEYTSAQSSDDEITGRITGNDFVLSALDESVVNGSDTTRMLSEAVADVLAGLDVTVSMAYPALSVVTAYPQGMTKREALRLLAQASCCTVWVDRDGVLQIHPLGTSLPDDELTADRMPTMGGIIVTEPVDCVVLTVRNEYAGTESVYVSGSGKRVKSISNPCVHPDNGQAAADWLLEQYNRRVKYNKPNRCNPAVEIGDTLKIHDAYGENRDAVVTGLVVIFGSDGLSAHTKAVK